VDYLISGTEQVTSSVRRVTFFEVPDSNLLRHILAEIFHAFSQLFLKKGKEVHYVWQSCFDL
jgi:hypothetical protein